MSAFIETFGSSSGYRFRTFDPGMDSVVAPLFGHAQDVATIVDLGPARWSDALLSETRAHLSGCLNAVNIAIGMALGDGWLSTPLDALGPYRCGEAIERRPALLSPLLVQHLRARAAAALILRFGRERPTRLIGPDPAQRSAVRPPRIEDAMAALALVTEGWARTHPGHLPMRPDLSAEAYSDLAWTAASLLIEGLVMEQGVDLSACCVVVARATEAVVARHEEQSGPFARAAYVAAVAGDGGNDIALAAEAVTQRNLLLFAALGARRASMTLDLAMTLLVDAADTDRAAFARIAGLEDDDFVALRSMLAPVRQLDDPAGLVAAIDEFRAMDVDDARAALARWTGPEALVARLARLELRR